MRNRGSKQRKTSLVIDREKVAEVREILGTRTLADTVDAALDEAIALAARRRLLDRIRREDGIGPSPAELRSLRQPRVAPRFR
jgi:Arc/MetJ family transcription regulator